MADRGLGRVLAGFRVDLGLVALPLALRLAFGPVLHVPLAGVLAVLVALSLVGIHA